MERTKTIATASIISEEEIAILVETSYANELHKHLTEVEKVNCSIPSPAIFRPKRTYRNAGGQVKVEEETIEHEMRVNGTLADFEKWMANFVLPARQ